MITIRLLQRFSGYIGRLRDKVKQFLARRLDTFV
jgi:hypothetical protein